MTADELRAELDRVNSLLEDTQAQTGVAYWEYKPQTQEISWSDFVFYTLELDPETTEPTDELFDSYLHPDDKDAFIEMRAHIADEGAPTEYEFRFLVNGVTKNMRMTWVAHRDSDGNIFRLIGATQDVTTLKRAEEYMRDMNRKLEEEVAQRTAELREQTKFNEQLIDTANAIILLLNPDGTIRYYNKYLENLSSRPLADTIGKNWFDEFLDGAEVERLHEVFDDIMLGEERNSIINDIILANGERRQIEWFNTDIVGPDGEKVGMLSVGHDITNRLLLESQLLQASKMASVGELATGIAHEINQPLSIIEMVSENLRNGIDRVRNDENWLIDKLERIQGQVRRASDITTHMRLFGSKSETLTESVNWDAVIQQSLILSQHRLTIAEITPEFDLGPEPTHIKGNAIQLEQVLVNLISNACDAAIERNVTHTSLKFSLSTEKESNTAVLHISDQAGGIPEHVRPRIFDPFFTTKEVGKGTGLGLSISYGIIKSMKGDIEVTNTNGGAKFTVRLPLFH